MMATAIARPALYYPFIHIRSEHWLKLTLLCFPKVVRMIPYGEYAPEDLPQIQRYVEPNRRGERLLDSRGTAAEFAVAAQQRLLLKIQANEEFITKTYARVSHGEKYLIHDAKMEPGLRSYLQRRNLARPDTDAAAVGHRSWLALHPVLGTAIMSSIALAIAEQYGFDIVTDQTATHETVISSNQDEIFDRLLGAFVHPGANQQTTTNELGQLVIGMTGLNLQALQPADIIELQEQKQDFRSFRKLLLEKGAEVGAIPDASERHERLQPIAAEIIQAWHDYQRALPKRLARVLFDASNIKVPEVLATAFANATTTLVAGVTAGLAVGMLAYSGLRLYDDYQQRSKSPYRWLSRVTSAQQPAALLACPIGLETNIGRTQH
ncbi:MAG: hypothetical protein ACKV22_39280 [Bryobacteraceae bacterium]